MFSDMFAAAELATVPLSYLAQIMEELISGGYIDGCTVIKAKEVTQFNLSENARVTMRGVEYLGENSRMKKAAEVAGKAFEILLSQFI